MQEECKFGEKCLRLDCKYVHNIRKRSVPCVHFQNKGCFKGDRCPYMHIPKTIVRPAESQINIDIAPVIPAEIALPSKRLSSEPIESIQEFPEDISAIIDQFEEVPSSSQVFLPPQEEETEIRSLHPLADISETIDLKPKSPVSDVKRLETPEKVLLAASEPPENDIISAKKSPQIVEKTPELKPSETPDLVEKNFLGSKTLESNLPDINQAEGKNNEPVLADEKTKQGQTKPSEVKLVESKSAEVKINEVKTPKGPDNFQKVPKASEGPPKIHQSGKNMIERTVKANRIEETVSLRPPERKKTAIEGATRILTLEEIKEKKRMEALIKEQEAQVKEQENPPKASQIPKNIAKPEEKPEEKPLKDVKPSEERAGKANTIISSPAIKTNETVILPVKRPVSNQVPVPLKQQKVLYTFPILVTGKEWEPYKQVLKSLDFTEFNLSPEDIKDCKKLAEVLSSPEGISKVIFDLEQKLSNYPDIPMDTEFESLTLTEKIEKMYQDLFKVN